MSANLKCISVDLIHCSELSSPVPGVAAGDIGRE